MASTRQGGIFCGHADRGVRHLHCVPAGDTAGLRIPIRLHRRRPLIIAAIAVNVAAFVLFLVANGAGPLLAARALEGVAVGATANTLGAVLLDLRPRGGLAPLMSSIAPAAGLAVGALLTSVLAQYGPAPTRLTWWLLLGAFAAALVLVAVMPEQEPGRPARWPRCGRMSACRAQPGGVHPGRARHRGRMGAGRLLPVAGTLAGRTAGRLPQPVVGRCRGLLAHRRGLSGLAGGPQCPRAAQMLGGCLALAAGAGVTIAAIETGTAAVLLLGTGIAGLGYWRSPAPTAPWWP